MTETMTVASEWKWLDKAVCDKDALFPHGQKPWRVVHNVPDLKARDRLVRRIRKMRADAVLDKSTLEHWNRTHPDGKQFSAAFEDKMIAWCDGKGPMPTKADTLAGAGPNDGGGDGK